MKPPISRKLALERTKKHQKDLAFLKKGWSVLGRDVKKSVDMGVPAALEMTMRGWIEKTFPGSSASHIFRQLADYEALKHVPESKLEKMPEGNAHQMTRLPEKERKNPELIQKAITLKPSEFKEVVDTVRATKMGIKPERWETLAVRVPGQVYDLLIAAQNKIGRVLQVDLEDSMKRPASLIAVWEAIAQLVNDTDESRLKLEIIGESEHALDALPYATGPIVQSRSGIDEVAPRNRSLRASEFASTH